MSNNPIENLITGLLSELNTMDYRERLAKRDPSFDEMLKSQVETLMNFETMDNEEISEFIRHNPEILIASIEGSLNALEVFSNGKFRSVPKGPTHINLVGAFSHWLHQNPEILQQFTASDLFNELCDSGKDGYEFDDNGN